MANWFPSIWKAICTTRSWKNDEKRRYFYADMGIAVCPLSNSRTFWPFELTSDRRVSPILPISTLQSPNQEGTFINYVARAIFGPYYALSLTFMCPFCARSVPFLCPVCALSTIWTDVCRSVSPIMPISTLPVPTKWTFINYVEKASSGIL